MKQFIWGEPGMGKATFRSQKNEAELTAYFDGETDANEDKPYENPYFDVPVLAAEYERGYNEGMEANADFAEQQGSDNDAGDWT